MGGQARGAEVLQLRRRQRGAHAAEGLRHLPIRGRRRLGLPQARAALGRRRRHVARGRGHDVWRHGLLGPCGSWPERRDDEGDQGERAAVRARVLDGRHPAFLVPECRSHGFNGATVLLVTYTVWVETECCTTGYRVYYDMQHQSRKVIYCAYISHRSKCTTQCTYADLTARWTCSLCLYSSLRGINRRGSAAKGRGASLASRCVAQCTLRSRAACSALSRHCAQRPAVNGAPGVPPASVVRRPNAPPACTRIGIASGAQARVQLQEPRQLARRPAAARGGSGGRLVGGGPPACQGASFCMEQLPCCTAATRH